MNVGRKVRNGKELTNENEWLKENDESRYIHNRREYTKWRK